VKGLKIYTGFSEPVTREIYQDALAHKCASFAFECRASGARGYILHSCRRIHAIGAGVVLAEIQQTSDITYRIYDWGRKDDREITVNCTLIWRLMQLITMPPERPV
jgi:mannose-6-phosphate isomerase